MNLLFVAAGGALGAVLRYLASVYVPMWLGNMLGERRHELNENADARNSFGSSSMAVTLSRLTEDLFNRTKNYGTRELAPFSSAPLARVMGHT